MVDRMHKQSPAAVSSHAQLSRFNRASQDGRLSIPAGETVICRSRRRLMSSSDPDDLGKMLTACMDTGSSVRYTILAHSSPHRRVVDDKTYHLATNLETEYHENHTIRPGQDMAFVYLKWGIMHTHRANRTA